MYSRVDEDFPFGKGKRAREREREHNRNEFDSLSHFRSSGTCPLAFICIFVICVSNRPTDCLANVAGHKLGKNGVTDTK